MLVRLTVLAIILPGPAVALAGASATPNTPNTGTTIGGDIDTSGEPNRGRIPNAATLIVQRGFRFDGRAVAGRCTRAQGARDACPSDSRIGSLSAQGSALVFSVPIDARLYLGEPRRAGDVASVVAVAQLQGRTISGVGRVRRSRGGALKFVIDVPPEVERFAGLARLERVTGTIGASRAVTRRGRTRTRHLLRTPRRCAGSWRFRVRINYGGGERATLRLPIPCRG